jgi:uncharacterized membrane protein YphA (DoxX/SURF4 family)
MNKTITLVARLLLGGAFVLFGLNGFFHFLPSPPLSAEAGAFLGGLAATGYFFPLLKGTEVVAGLLLVGGRFVPLALTVLAPILVQILAFHLRFGGPGMAIVLVALELYLAWSYRDAFKPLLLARAAGGGAKNAAEPRTSAAVDRGTGVPARA